jgi:hypothetical protein
MKSVRVLSSVIAVAAIIGLSACAPGSVVAPITVNANDVQGETIELPLNTVLNINTGDLAVDSYTADIADPSVVEFTQGKDDGSATFNPGLKPLKVGETQVTMTNEQGGIQPLEFTVKVVPTPGGGNIGGHGR